MKQLTLLSIILSVLFLSCAESKDDNETQFATQKDTSQDHLTEISHDSFYDSIQFSVKDTIRTSKSYFFSNSDSKDLFLLTIPPGRVINSKSILQIITADNYIIYTNSFDSYFFIKWLVYDEILTKDYPASLAEEQYEAYFKKSVDSFFNALVFFETSGINEALYWGDIIDNDFFEEIKADTTIPMVDIICFDCDEGASIIGYSRKRKKVVTLLEHD